MIYTNCKLFQLHSKKLLKYYLNISDNHIFDQKHVSSLIQPYIDETAKPRIIEKPDDILKEIQSIPEFVIVPPSTKNKMLIRGCDYLVQLSDTESFCYSAFEALQRGVPVILSRFPEAYNIVEEGKNGYLVDMDLSDLDIDKIFNHKPQDVSYVDRCDYKKWEKVFKGEL